MYRPIAQSIFAFTILTSLGCSETSSSMGEAKSSEAFQKDSTITDTDGLVDDKSSVAPSNKDIWKRRRQDFARIEGYFAEDFFRGLEILPLCEAIEGGDHERFEELIASDLDLSQTGKFGTTVAIWAYLCGYPDVVMRLID